jgi:hypothetical protein
MSADPSHYNHVAWLEVWTVPIDVRRAAPPAVVKH